MRRRLALSRHDLDARLQRIDVEGWDGPTAGELLSYVRENLVRIQVSAAGLSGPAIFPLALRLVWQVCGAVKIPVVACGGVTTSFDCISMMLAGASAVEVGTAFFRDIK